MFSYRRQSKRIARLPAAIVKRGPSPKSVDFPSFYQSTGTLTTPFPINSALLTPTDGFAANSDYWLVDYPANSTDATYPSSVLTLTKIINGSSISQRIGRVIKVHSVLVKGSFQKNIQANYSTMADDGQPARFRIALVYDRQANSPVQATGLTGTAPTWLAFASIFGCIDTQVLTQSTLVATAKIPTGIHFDSWSPPNPNNAYRFIVLRDCRYDLQPDYIMNPTLASVAAPYRNLQQFLLNQNFVSGNACGFWKNTKNLETRYGNDPAPGSTVPSISDCVSGAIYVICYGESFYQSTSYQYLVQARVRFTDAL